MLSFIIGKFNYWLYITLMMVGFWAMISKNNLVKKVIGMNIFQTAIILFYVSIGAKFGGTLPILTSYSHGPGPTPPVDVAAYINPLPHVLMLTAIVVSVATLGVALAILIRIYRECGSLEEDEILKVVQ